MPYDHNGFSLVSALISVSLLSGLVLLISRVQTDQVRTIAHWKTRTQGRDQVFQALQLIKRVGKSSQSCVKQSTPFFGLECQGYFHSANTLELFRFAIIDSALEYQKFVEGQYRTQIRFAGVADIEICDTLDIEQNRCTDFLPALVLPSSSAVKSQMTNRFFRFRLVSASDPKSSLSARRAYQAAFFIRNPSDIDPLLSFRFGGGE